MQWLRLFGSVILSAHPSRWLIAAALLSGACLSVDDVPGEDPEACAENTDPDPLVGVWESETGSCEFFSNARYRDACGIVRSGFASEWMRLEDGRYFFGASSLGSPSGQCLGVATFTDACDTLTLKLDCTKSALELTRRK